MPLQNKFTHALLRRWAVLAGFAVLATGCVNENTAEDRLTLVKENMRRGDYGAASLELANLIQARPTHLEARLLQGKVSLAVGRAAAAEEQLKQAYELGAPGRYIYQPLAQSIIAQGQPERVPEALGSPPAARNDREAWIVAMALGAMQSGQLDRARQRYEEVAAADPDNIDAQLGLAAIDRASGDFASAETRIEAMTTAHPLSVAAWQAMGALRYEQDRLVDAERAFINAIEGSDAIDRSHEYMLARVGLVETQWHLDKKSLAVQNAQELLDSYPWHPLPKFMRALLAFLDQDYEIAGDLLYRVITVIPDHEPSLKLLATINSAEGKLGRAQLYLDKYFALNDADPDMRLLMAETYLQMGNAEESVETLRPLINDSTTRADFLDLYGTACRYASACQNGEDYLARAVDVEPENIRRQTRLAAAYLNQSDLTLADALMSSWVPPESVTEASRQVLRLERFLRSGQLDRATEYAKKLRRKNPANLHALLALAEVSHIRGDIEQESAWLELARERNPDAVEPRLLLAARHMTKGRYEQAVKVSQEAAAAHPYNASVLRILAHALIQLGRYNEALSTATEARRLAPRQWRNRLTLVHAYWVNGDRSKARALTREMLNERPLATGQFRSMVIDMHTRGLQRKAHEFVEVLEELGREPDVTAEIRGDLFFLEADNQRAGDAYRQAAQRRSTPLRSLKSRLARTDDS